jgi:restriction system protein
MAFEWAMDPYAFFKTVVLTNWPYLIGLLLLGLLSALIKSPTFKGWWGELQIRLILRRLDPHHYQCFHDLYLPRPDGQGTTQIDHVVVSLKGIFVIETKNYRGWIFGSEEQRQWTQQIYKCKEHFQNPLHQNHLHIRALMKFLDLPNSVFHSVIFFIGHCKFKTPMPPNVLDRGLKQWIEKHRIFILCPDKVTYVNSFLTNHAQNTNKKAAARLHSEDQRMRT